MNPCRTWRAAPNPSVEPRGGSPLLSRVTGTQLRPGKTNSWSPRRRRTRTNYKSTKKKKTQATRTVSAESNQIKLDRDGEGRSGACAGEEVEAVFGRGASSGAGLPPGGGGGRLAVHEDDVAGYGGGVPAGREAAQV